MSPYAMRLGNAITIVMPTISVSLYMLVVKSVAEQLYTRNEIFRVSQVT